MRESLSLLWEDQAPVVISDAYSLLFIQESRDMRTTFSLLLSPCLKPERISSLAQKQHHNSCCVE